MTSSAAGAVEQNNGKRSLLHVGCGVELAPEVFDEYIETRLDIDPQWEPDIVANMTDLSCIADGTFDAIYTSHSLEHLFPEDARMALKEFRRVLTDGGFVLIVVPDLEGVKPDNQVLFTAPAGEITGRHLHYGYGPHIKKYGPCMVHRSGFVRESLASYLMDAGFSQVHVDRVREYNLMGAAVK